MSRKGLYLSFQCRDSSIRTYFYGIGSAAAYVMGSDPKDLQGEEVAGMATELAMRDAAEDLLEMLAE